MVSPVINQSFSIPTTNVWDLSAVESLEINADLKELLVRLYQNVNNISLAVNGKETSYYNTNAFLNNQFYFPNPSLNSSTGTQPSWRPVIRTVVNFGALPNATTKSVPHNLPLNTVSSATNYYGASTDHVAIEMIKLPFSSPTLNRNIEVTIDDTNVNVTTAIDWTAFTDTTIVIEYLSS